MGVSTSGRSGAIGQSFSGCLERSRLHVSSVCGAIPGEDKTGQVLPSCAREIAESKQTWGVIIIIIQVEYIISIGLDCQRDIHPSCM